MLRSNPSARRSSIGDSRDNLTLSLILFYLISRLIFAILVENKSVKPFLGDFISFARVHGTIGSWAKSTVAQSYIRVLDNTRLKYVGSYLGLVTCIRYKVSRT
ncbi:hypothetical protein Dtox_4093 [Desulfofarcimen acetoxidans DSM 771]|uniref:Uncharacterized protein n=1 Tax=Desulfofarcimen acetoxidans (strain ATCC 49208 / DSM 771 / KCTC 5769 / VKM B-1644 / 5575) TaxID=485916 RepID=C8VYP5_DESAS|nr:hypothetical protein Dtox_4093 [Desulfofarcimen acetoxidans DSM 771]